MDDALAQNEARARSLVVIPVVTWLVAVALVVVVVLVALGQPLIGLVLALLVGIGGFFGLTAAVRQKAPAVMLAATGSLPVTEADEPRLHNLVEGLCVGIGLEPPRLRIIEDEAANALALARSVDDADLVVTRGLLTRLSLVELEAVLAHELARIRRGEAIVGTLAGPTLGAIGGVFPASMLAAVTRAIVGRGEPVESWSDLAAVEITRYPPGLAAALQTLAGIAPVLPSGARPALAHLWIHGARVEGAFGQAVTRVYEPVPSVAQRIEVLEEL